MTALRQWPQKVEAARQEIVDCAEYGTEELKVARQELRRNQLETVERRMVDVQYSLERIARLAERAKSQSKT